MIKNLQKQLKNLAPQQKIDFLQELLKNKKGKEKDQILTLIREAKQEQILLEESIRKFESRSRHEEHLPEEPLETIVEEEVAAQVQSKKEPTQLYGSPIKPEDIYGSEKLQTKYLSPEARKNSEYKSQPEFPNRNAFTQEERNLINTESHRLEKQKKKYETGTS